MQNLQSYFLDFLQVTQQAALACHPFIGKMDNMAADQAAVNAMRDCFQKMDIDIQIVIGEGERDQAPRLYTGENLGNPKASFKIDVAVDPLEGTNICAQDKEGALAVMSIALREKLFKAPDIYMKKLACGPKAKGSIDLNVDVASNILNVSQSLNKKPTQILVGVLKRDRHQKLIEEIKKTGALVRLVDDGDVALALETALEASPIDLLMGTGGAPEGVLAASGLKCLGGDFKGQLVYNNEEERQRTRQAGVKDLDKVFSLDDLVPSEVWFYATGVTKGPLLKGVTKNQSHWQSQSLVLSKDFMQTITSQHKI